MLKINKQTITLTKGDDASLRLVPKYKDKTAYTVQEGDRAVVRLKIGNVVKVIECSVNTETNKIVVNFDPDDTKDFNPGIYRYEAELITSFGFHYTFIADQSFILGKELEEHILPNTNRNGSTSGNLPEIDGDMGEEPVVNGEIQPTNPMMDYDELNHLPKLNNVVIKGDHDSAYYGLATKTSDLENDSDFVSDANYVHTDSNFTAEEKTKLGTVESGAEKNVQSDWTQVDTTKDDYIKNKPTKLSQFTNDQGFVTNAVQNLMFYYLKSETYTKAEVEQLISAIKQGKFVVVETLPQNPDPNVIYLVPKSPAQTSNAYDEYVYINNAWEKIGDTDIDLSGFVTDEELTTALQAYLTSADFYTAIANYYTKTETETLLNGKVDKVSGKGLSTNDYDNTAKGIVDGVTSALDGKVDKETGKGLSTNDYTTAEKTKLAGISEGANKVESSETNGNIKINGVETQVYDDSDIQDELSTDYATVEGNPLNFNTLSAQTAKSTILSVRPIQDLSHGVPSPENICPISGRTEIGISGCGANIAEFTDGYSINAQGEIVPLTSYRRSATINPIIIEPNVSYKVVSKGSSPGSFILAVWNDNTLVRRVAGISSGSTLDTSNGNKFYVCSYEGYIDTLKPMVVKNDIPEEYSPYIKSNDITVEFGQEVYSVQLAVESGELIIDGSYVEYSSSQTLSTISSTSAGFTKYWLAGYPTIDINRKNEIISNCVPYSDERTSANYSFVNYSSTYPNSLCFQLPTSLIGTTEETIRAYLEENPVNVWVPLANPITINLTPHTIKLLEGVNNISVDDASATISLTYRDGSVATLGDLTSAVDSLDGKIEDSKILTDTVTGDKYILVVTNGVLDIQQVSN